MKTLKNKNGFTLIELLAVIVVLAIVTVLATTTMLPLMNRAIASGFVDEANAARESAADVMTLISINSFNVPAEENSDYRENGNKVCISLKLMAQEGLYDKDIEFFDEEKPEYEGKVIITKKDASSNNYTYKIKMHNADYYVEKEGKVKEEDAVEYNSSAHTDFGCTATDVGES